MASPVLPEEILGQMDSRETRVGRTTEWTNSFETFAQLKDEIENYEPLADLLTGEVQFPQVNILLFGEVGVGKSTVFNTINSSIRGKMFNVALSSSAEHVVTKRFRRYQVMSKSAHTSPRSLKFRLCDMRGLEYEHLMTKENMRCLLEGHVEDRFPFDPSGYISSNMPGFKKNPDLHEKIHCVAIVVDAFILDAMQILCPEVTKNIKDMQTVMNNLDIPQVVILTKIDHICEDIHYDTANACKSPKIHRWVAKASDLFGLPRNAIFPMKNYEKECNLDLSIDIMALRTLRGILSHCDAHLFHHYHEIVQKYRVTERHSS